MEIDIGGSGLFSIVGNLVTSIATPLIPVGAIYALYALVLFPPRVIRFALFAMRDPTKEPPNPAPREKIAFEDMVWSRGKWRIQFLSFVNELILHFILCCAAYLALQHSYFRTIAFFALIVQFLVVMTRDRNGDLIRSIFVCGCCIGAYQGLPLKPAAAKKYDREADACVRRLCAFHEVWPTDGYAMLLDHLLTTGKLTPDDCVPGLLHSKEEYAVFCKHKIPLHVPFQRVVASKDKENETIDDLFKSARGRAKILHIEQAFAKLGLPCPEMDRRDDYAPIPDMPDVGALLDLEYGESAQTQS